MAIEFFFSILWISLILTENFMYSKSNSSSNSLSIFLILAGWQSAGCKYLTKHHLKHWSLSKFWVITKPFFGWSNLFGNWI